MSDSQNTSQNPQPQSIRQSDARLYLGLLGATEFLFLDTMFVICLLDPPNPEVKRSFWPFLCMALLMGTLMSTMTIGAFWMFAEYFLSKLTISEDQFTLRNCFQNTKIDPRTITTIDWKPGAIGLTVNGRRTSIDISAYSEENIADLFDYFHNGFPLEIQHNWLKFIEAIERAHEPQIPKYCRWLAIPIVIVLLALGTLTALAWFNLGGAPILLGSLAFFAVGLWYIWSFATFRDENALIRSKMAKTTPFLRSPRYANQPTSCSETRQARRLKAKSNSPPLALTQI